MGRHLLKERGISVPGSIADSVAYDQVADSYLADHPGVFTDSGDRYYVDGFTADFVDCNALGKSMMKEDGVALTSFGIVKRYDHYIRQLPEELTTLHLFSPLYPRVFTYDEYGNLNWEPEEMSTHELCDYREEILRAIADRRLDSEGDRGLAVYLRNALLGRKVYSMNPTVEEWDGRLWGVLEVQTRGELTEGELRELTEEWLGQMQR